MAWLLLQWPWFRERSVVPTSDLPLGGDTKGYHASTQASRSPPAIHIITSPDQHNGVFRFVQQHDWCNGRLAWQ